MRVTHLWLTDFRNHEATELVPAPDGLTVLIGANGEGKTNVLEAVSWLATLDSFRGAPADAMVRNGCEQAVVRADVDHAGRSVLLEGALGRRGRARVQVNRQPLRRTRDLLGSLRTSVFSPDDLVLVKGGPAERRRYLDELLVSRHPRWDEVRGDVERIVRQRTALLKQAAGSRTVAEDLLLTLDVWDAKLVQRGGELAAARRALLDELGPFVSTAYADLSSSDAPVALGYDCAWAETGLAAALGEARREDLRRGVTTVGPHRDDVAVLLDGLPARTHSSQGEQRSLALAFRLAGHRLVSAAVDDDPVLLLDDVFSELDPARRAALLEHLPAGQALLTTTGPVPDGVLPAAVFVVRGGVVSGAA